jgi:hypothetical protein
MAYESNVMELLRLQESEDNLSLVFKRVLSIVRL